MKIADPICSLFIAILITVSVMPLVKETSLVLLLWTPSENLEQLQGALIKVRIKNYGIHFAIWVLPSVFRNN